MTKLNPNELLAENLVPLNEALSVLATDLNLVGDCATTYETVLEDLQNVKQEFTLVIESDPVAIPRQADFSQRFDNLDEEAQYIMAACSDASFPSPGLLTQDMIQSALLEWKARINYIIANLNANVKNNPAVSLANLTNTSISSTTPAGTTFKDCQDSFCPIMTVVPPGSYMMGATEEELTTYNVAADRRHWELPRHQLTLSKPFAVGIHEVTLASFKQFVQETGHEVLPGCRTYLPNGDATGQLFRENINYENIGFPFPENPPVSCITKEDAIAYTKWLSQKTGKKYRLPSESEWEYFARGGTQTPYIWGNDIALATNYANVYDQSSYAANGFYANATTPFAPFPGNDNNPYQASVGSLLPNNFGLFDVSGNVREWVLDSWYDDSQGNYVGAPTDGSPRTTGTRFGISRGGAWYYQSPNVRVSYRNAYVSSEMRGVTWGFRLVREI